MIEGNVGIAGEAGNWDFGQGAGFYVNATQDPWAENYQMYDYILKELPQLLLEASVGLVRIISRASTF